MTTDTQTTAPAPTWDQNVCTAYGVPEHAHPVEDLGADWLCPDCSIRLTAAVIADQRYALVRELDTVTARKAALYFLRVAGQEDVVQRVIAADHEAAVAERVARAVRALETIGRRVRTVRCLLEAGLPGPVAVLVELDRDDAVRMIAGDAQLPDLGDRG